MIHAANTATASNNKLYKGGINIDNMDRLQQIIPPTFNGINCITTPDKNVGVPYNIKNIVYKYIQPFALPSVKLIMNIEIPKLIQI